MARSRTGGLSTMDEIKKALSTDLKKDGSRWEMIKDGFTALWDRVRKSDDPAASFPPALQRELAPLFIASMTNERSALVLQAKLTLMALVDLLGIQSKELSDRIIFSLLKQTGTGNGTNAGHAVDAVLTVVKFVPSTSLVTETIRARIDIINVPVQVICHRVLNIIFATWPLEIVHKVTSFSPYESDLHAMLLAGASAGSDIVRRLTRVNFRILRGRFPIVAGKFIERHRAKLPDKWEAMGIDPAIVREDEVRLRAALDGKAAATAAREDARTAAVFFEAAAGVGAEDAVSMSEPTSPVKSGRASPRLVSTPLAETAASIESTAAAPAPKAAKAPVTKAISKVAIPAVSPRRTADPGMRMLAGQSKPADARRPAAPPRSPAASERGASPTFQRAPVGRAPAMKVIPRAPKHATAPTDAKANVTQYTATAASAGDIAQQLHVHVRQHIGYAAKAYEHMIHAPGYSLIAQKILDAKARQAEVDHLAVESAKLRLTSSPASGAERLLSVAANVLQPGGAGTPVVSTAELAMFLSNTLASMTEMRDKCAAVVEQLHEAQSMLEHLPASPHSRPDLTKFSAPQDVPKLGITEAPSPRTVLSVADSIKSPADYVAQTASLEGDGEESKLLEPEGGGKTAQYLKF